MVLLLIKPTKNDFIFRLQNASLNSLQMFLFEKLTIQLAQMGVALVLFLGTSVDF